MHAEHSISIADLARAQERLDAEVQDLKSGYDRVDQKLDKIDDKFDRFVMWALGACVTFSGSLILFVLKILAGK